MRTYRDILAIPEFRALLAGNSLAVAGLTVQQLALSALVYERTSSPLLAAVAYLGGFLPQAIGAATLLSLADRVRPRTFLARWNVARAGVALVLALDVLPVAGMIGLVMAVGVVDAVATAVRTSVVADVVGQDGYVVGRSLLNLSVGTMQILGYATGGTLLAALGPRPALLTSAALATSTALVLGAGLRSRAPVGRGRASLRATSQGNRALLGDRTTRALLLAGWIPNGLIVGAEALYVPYAGDSAGTLFAAAAAGMLAGDLLIGRWVPSSLRPRLIVPLRILLAVPYLGFAGRPGTWLAAALVAIASVGFAASLALQERLLAVVPDDLRGHALGLAGSGMLTSQAIGAAAAGLTAELTTPALAMTIAALASLAATTLLAPLLRTPSITTTG